MTLTEDPSVYSVVQLILSTIPWAKPCPWHSEARCCSLQRSSFTGKAVWVALWKLQHYPGFAQPCKAILNFVCNILSSRNAIFRIHSSVKRWQAYFKASIFQRRLPASFLQWVLIFLYEPLLSCLPFCLSAYSDSVWMHHWLLLAYSLPTQTTQKPLPFLHRA